MPYTENCTKSVGYTDLKALSFEECIYFFSTPHEGEGSEIISETEDLSSDNELPNDCVRIGFLKLNNDGTSLMTVKTIKNPVYRHIGVLNMCNPDINQNTAFREYRSTIQSNKKELDDKIRKQIIDEIKFCIAIDMGVDISKVVTFGSKK